jgi:hypothetical protein
MPDIDAEGLPNAFRAMGFVTAQDRLFRMELTRLLAGPPASCHLGSLDAFPGGRKRTWWFSDAAIAAHARSELNLKPRGRPCHALRDPIPRRDAIMAVITRYVVVRQGVEIEPVFSVKKEAEAYDKMLDAAEDLAGFIKNGELDLPVEDAAVEAVALLLAKRAPEVVKILKGIKPVLTPSEVAAVPEPEKTAPRGEKKRGPGSGGKRGPKEG